MSYRGKVWLSVFTGCVLFWILIGFAAASPLDKYAEDWRGGVALPEVFGDFYVRSADRQIEFSHVQNFDGRIDAYYKASAVVNSEQLSEQGVASYYLRGDEVVGVEYAVIRDKYLVDLAYAGQAADVASTAIGLSQGFVEGNPLLTDAVGSAGGLALIGAAKTGLIYLADQQGLGACMQARTMLGTLGWGAAAWNMGLVLATPAVAVASGLASALIAYKYVKEEAPVRCIRPE